jgi:hypothetical protein
VSHNDPEFLALAALGEHAGTPDDAAHLARCPDCQQELDRLTRLVDLARADGPVFLEEPPAAVWDRIAAATGTAGTAGPGPAPGRPAQPDEIQVAANGSQVAANGHRPRSAGILNGHERVPAGTRPAAPGRPGRRRRLGRAAAGLAAGLIIGIGGTVAAGQLTRTAPPVVAQFALRPLPQFPQWEHTAGTAVLRDTQAAQQLTVTVSAPAPAGFYEVWLLGANGTSMISLGDLNTERAGTFTLPAQVNLRFYSRVDVSLQPFNGSTQHSAMSVVRGSLPASVTASGSRG